MGGRGVSGTHRTRPDRRHAGFAAFLVHRISGLLLALFLPLHFLTLGLALNGARAMDAFLVFAELPWVKASEWLLVVLLSVHLAFGLRILVLELSPWRGARKQWIGWGAGLAIAAGLLFAAGVS